MRKWASVKLDIRVMLEMVTEKLKLRYESNVLSSTDVFNFRFEIISIVYKLLYSL
jgi:hypothetical protein